MLLPVGAIEVEAEVEVEIKLDDTEDPAVLGIFTYNEEMTRMVNIERRRPK